MKNVLYGLLDASAWHLLGFAMAVLIAFVIVCMTGCASRSQEERQEQTDSETTTRAKGSLRASGTVGFPVPGSVPLQIIPVPVELVIERRETAMSTTSTEGTSRAQVRTEIDGDAIGRQVASIATAAISAAIQQAVPGLSALKAPGEPDWGMVLSGALSAATTGAGAIALMQRKRAIEHKADADEAWDRLTDKKEA